MTTTRKYRVYNELTDHTIAVVEAPNEIAALLGISWGYAGPRFDKDLGGRPAADCGGEGIYRAEEAEGK